MRTKTSSSLPSHRTTRITVVMVPNRHLQLQLFQLTTVGGSKTDNLLANSHRLNISPNRLFQPAHSGLSNPEE